MAYRANISIHTLCNLHVFFFLLYNRKKKGRKPAKQFIDRKFFCVSECFSLYGHMRTVLCFFKCLLFLRILFYFTSYSSSTSIAAQFLSTWPKFINGIKLLSKEKGCKQAIEILFPYLGSLGEIEINFNKTKVYNGWKCCAQRQFKHIELCYSMKKSICPKTREELFKLHFYEIQCKRRGVGGGGGVKYVTHNFVVIRCLRRKFGILPHPSICPFLLYLIRSQ